VFEVFKVLDRIHTLKDHNETYGKKSNYIVMSSPIYSFFRDECMKVVGIPGDVTIYMGMTIVVLDRSDNLLIVG